MNAAVAVGDRVRIVTCSAGQIYHAGKEGTVTHVGPTYASVDFGEKSPCEATAVEVIGAAPTKARTVYRVVVEGVVPYAERTVGSKYLGTDPETDQAVYLESLHLVSIERAGEVVRHCRCCRGCSS